MKQAKTIVKATNATAVDFGKLAELSDYVLELSPEVKIPGKVFGGAAVGAREVNSRFNHLPQVQKQALYTRIRIMRNFTSF